MDFQNLGFGLDSVKEGIAWISGFTGLSTLAVIFIGISIGSRIIKAIVKFLIMIVIIAVGLFAWTQLS